MRVVWRFAERLKILRPCNAQKIKFSIQDLFSKCDQIRSFKRIWSHLLKKFFKENFILCALLGDKKILRESQNYVEAKPSAQTPF